MILEDVQFFDVLKGKCVRLTVKNSSFVGVVQRINPNKTLILADVVNEGRKIPGTKLFFGREILNVELVYEAPSGGGDAQDTFDNPVVEKQRMEKILLASEGYEEECLSFVVVDKFHENFVPAVMHIKRQHAIGVGVDGVGLFKHGRLCWLQIATKNRVYLFDILLLGARAFKNGLSSILENERILKVIHNCRVIAGSLISQFGVKLTNVFDTQVADVVYFYSETGGFLPDRVSTLEEVVSLHLKIPSSQLLSLHMKSQLTQEEMPLWQKRPCPIPLLKLMALSVIHLQPLRLALIDTLMMDYMALVDSYLHSSHYEPGELQHVSMESVLELPAELRNLEEMRRERQEWASEHYPVTEQGLLARFSPRASSETSQQSNKQEESCQPSSVKSPASTQVCPTPHKSPVSPQSITNDSSFDIIVSPNPAAQAPVPGVVPDLRKDLSANISSELPGGGRGTTKPLLETVGRGRLFGKEQSPTPALPAIGRGFLLQLSQAQISNYLSSKLGGAQGSGETPGGIEKSTTCPDQMQTEV